MSLNRVQLLGNVGKDPEVRYLDSGVCVAQFSLATTTKGYTSKSGTQVPERTEWHNIVAWRGIAQVIEKYVRKGDKLYVEGELRYRTYEGQDGVNRHITEIYIESMEMLSQKGEGKPMPPVPEEPAEVKADSRPVQRNGTSVTGQPSSAPVQGKVDFSNDGSDDLPF